MENTKDLLMKRVPHISISEGLVFGHDWKKIGNQSESKMPNACNQIQPIIFYFFNATFIHLTTFMIWFPGKQCCIFSILYNINWVLSSFTVIYNDVIRDITDKHFYCMSLNGGKTSEGHIATNFY